jgi:hypothetical protein
MPERKNDSPSGDSANLVASLLARIDQLVAQLSARDERIDELLALVKAQNVRIAELEAKLGGPRRRRIIPRCRLRAGRRRMPSRRRARRSGARAAPASLVSWPKSLTRHDVSTPGIVRAAPNSAKPDRNSRKSTIISTFRRSGRSRRASNCSAPSAPPARRE